MKRIAVVIFAVLALIISLPIVSVSSETEINDIKVTVDEVIIGKVPSKQASFTTDVNGGLTLDSVTWFRIAEEDFDPEEGAFNYWVELEEDEPFKSGYYYSVDVWFNVDEGYVLSSEVTGSINGVSHSEEFWKITDWDGQAYLSVNLGLLKEKDITKIEANVNEPKIGEKVYGEVFYTTEEENGLTLVDVYYGKIAKADYSGSTNDEWIMVEEDEVFTEGYYYIVSILFDVNDGYKVSEDVIGTINGKEHDDTYGIISYNDGENVVLCVVYEPLIKQVPATGDSNLIRIAIVTMVSSATLVLIVDKKKRR